MDEIELAVEADEVCPSPEAAAKQMESHYSDPSIDEPATVDLLVPGTICWYLVTFDTVGCDHWPTRERLLESVASRGEDPHFIGIGCDAGLSLYPRWLPAAVTTQSEAAAATPAECPAAVEQEIQYTGQRGDLGEFVDSDFIPARVICSYDLHYECSGSCGAPPSGGLN